MGASIAGGVKTTSLYDALGRQTAKTAVNQGGLGNAVYAMNGMSYAPNGLLKTVNDDANWTHSYDEANRLLGTASAGQAFSFGYDRWSLS